jgi:beta-glucanase (GH16 family)
MRLARISATLLLGGALVATGCSTSPTAAASQSAKVQVLPQISQQGTKLRSSGSAKAVVMAKFSPARSGRAVVFQRKAPGSRTWRTVRRTTERGNGTAYYMAANSTVSGASFRVKAARTSRLASFTSSAATGTWHRVFGDDFNGSGLDAKTWSVRNVGAYIPSRTRSTNSPDAVHVGGGTLRLQVKPDPKRNRCKTARQTKSCYINGQVSPAAGPDSFTYRYGVAAARIKFPSARGQHGSFWTQSPTFYSYPGRPGRAGAEIDTVEFFGKGYPHGGLANFLYYLNAKKKSVKLGSVWPRASSLIGHNDAWWKSYHVFSMKWTPSSYTFFVDGKLLWSTTRAVSRTKEYPILSLLSSDWELPDRPSRTATATMNVDWTKIWQTG